MAARLTAYLVVVIVAGTLIAGLIVGAQRDDSDGPVDLIVRNAAVYTADGRSTLAEAVAVRGNQILRVGTNRDIDRFQRPQTIVVDAKGGAVVPGFNDAHLDLIAGGLSLEDIDLAGTENIAEVVERVSAWSAMNPTSAWVIGRNWPLEHARGSAPTRQMLDAVVSDRPVVLFADGGGSAWANTVALRAAGLTRRTPDPADGSIVREPRTKEPAGLLQGSAAMLVAKLIPGPAAEDRELALRRAIAEANAFGITSVQNPYDSIDAFPLYDGLKRARDLTLRIYSALPVASPLTDADLARLAATRTKYPDDPLFKTGALGIRVDGPLAAKSAALLARDAAASEAEDAPETATFDPDALNRTVRLADAAGWQLMLDANGDRAVRMSLNAYAHAARSNRAPARGRRHRLETVALVDAEDVTRFGPLGVLASMQPAGAYPSPQRLAALNRAIGEERTARTFALQSLAAESKLILGSGWPKAPMNPLVGLHVAVNRTTEAGTPDGGWQPAERVELKSAIDASTSAAAWASFDEQRKGLISPGMLADLVVLSDNIFTMPAEHLATTSVAYTIFDGKVVYTRPGRPDSAPAPSLQH